jgi:hypothetical protein
MGLFVRAAPAICHSVRCVLDRRTANGDNLDVALLRSTTLRSLLLVATGAISCDLSISLYVAPFPVVCAATQADTLAICTDVHLVPARLSSSGSYAPARLPFRSAALEASLHLHGD